MRFETIFLRQDRNLTDRKESNPMTTAVSLTLMALCLLLSAYFSATETAFSSLSTAKMRTLAEQGDPGPASPRPV